MGWKFRNAWKKFHQIPSVWEEIVAVMLEYPWIHFMQMKVNLNLIEFFFCRNKKNIFFPSFCFDLLKRIFRICFEMKIALKRISSV